MCRNLSSVNEKTRQQMRELPGLVDSLVNYIKSSLDDKSEDKVGDGRDEEEDEGAQPMLLSNSDSICLSLGGGKCSLHPEEPLLPTLP